MNDILREIIADSLKMVSADRLLSLALDKENLPGDFHLVAIGKAASAMAKAAHDHFGERIIDGLIIAPYDLAEPVHNFTTYEAGHPYPDDNSLLAGQALTALAKKLNRKDQLLLLISGGTSALVEIPRPGVTISDIRDITRKLQLAGADIIELNTVRKHLSLLKGGQLAELADPADIFSFLLSDVAGDRPDTIGSGLAAPDNTTSQAALSILDKFQINASPQIIDAIRQETPAKLRNVVQRIIGNNELLCQITAETIMKTGYIPWLITSEMAGEAKSYARLIPDIVKNARSPKSRINLPCIAICGGETTVKVNGKGKGGRNQELALAAAIAIRNLNKVTVAAIASDGRDGNNDYAGAIVDTNSYDRLLSTGTTPEIALRNNDSSTALSKIDAVINTGNTNTNLNDLLLILIEKIT
jgi:glycerate 2-kinase